MNEYRKLSWCVDLKNHIFMEDIDNELNEKKLIKK